MENEKLTEINISKAELTKLQWALPFGTDQQRVSFALRQYIKNAEAEEGVTYPTDRAPEHDFDGFTLKSN